MHVYDVRIVCVCVHICVYTVTFAVMLLSVTVVEQTSYSLQYIMTMFTGIIIAEIKHYI